MLFCRQQLYTRKDRLVWAGLILAALDPARLRCSGLRLNLLRWVELDCVRLGWAVFDTAGRKAMLGLTRLECFGWA